MCKVSVLMSTYNEPIEWIVNAIESILNQTYKNIEFIIIDDNPQYTELKETLNHYKEQYSFIKIIYNKKNLGLVASLNKGLKICEGDFVARMDADDWSYPNRIEEELNYIAKMDYDIVGTNFEVFWENDIIETMRHPKRHEICEQVLNCNSCVAHPTWFVKKSVYDILDGYRDIVACEDYDFLIRAVSTGYKIGNLNRVLLKYRANPNGISHKKEDMQKKSTFLLAKWYRNNKIISIEEYYEYMSLSNVSKIFEEKEIVDRLQSDIRSKNFALKISAIGRSLFNKYYLNYKLQKIKRNILYTVDKYL